MDFLNDDIDPTIAAMLADVNDSKPGYSSYDDSSDSSDFDFSTDNIGTTAVDLDGNPTMDLRYNPNSSMYAIEGIISPDGRVLGKMGHSERISADCCTNVDGIKDQPLFKSGIRYFK